MKKITAMVRFYYDQEFEIEVEDPENYDEIDEKFTKLAEQIKVWDGTNSHTVNFSTYDIEVDE